MGLVPGDTLQGDKYRIEKWLRSGLTTVSYLAKRSDGSRWVIKVLDPQVLVGLSDEERNRAETLFIQEAVKLERCSGTTHIVRTGLYFKEGDLLCLPVEYIGGDSLAERSQLKLTEETALTYIRQIGEALAVVHAQGLVHRDIRPSNIFVRIEGSRIDAVLTGFGLAMDCDTPLTRTRAKELKDGFSPVELYARGRPVGEYTDVYSLAATLYELLTGVVPASAEMRRTDERTFVPPRILNPDITEGTSEAIVTGMSFWAKDRPQTVADWLARLGGEGRVKSEGQQKALIKASENAVDWAKWGAIWTAVGGVAATVAVLAAVGMWLWDGMKDDPALVVPVDSEPAAVQESPEVPDESRSEQDASSQDAEP